MKMYLPPPGQKSTRRTVLKRGLVGGALLALGGAGFLAFRKSAAVSLPADGLQVLSPREYAIAWAIALRIFPARPGWPTAEHLQVARGCDRILSQTDATAQAETKQLLMLFENALANFLFGRRTQPFTLLSGEEQDQVLREWQTSGITVRRTGYLALRTLVMAAAYASREVWLQVGYAGPPPGIHDPTAPEWKGGGTPRPPSNGLEVAPAREGAKGTAP